MMRSKFIFSLTIVGALSLICAAAQAGDKSDAKVKASAAAKKSGADGKQVVTITLDVEKNWYIYANPVNANSDVFAGNETRITFQAKDKVMNVVQYPKGKQKMDDKYKFDIYAGKVTIQADVQRTMGGMRARSKSAFM